VAHRLLDDYTATIDQYERAPDPQVAGDPLSGQGKKKLVAHAQYWEAQRERALRQDPNFDYAEALMEIAIVLGSVAILGASRLALGLGVAVGSVGAVLMLNGFFLWVDLPFG
jgi:hypothetical protein